MRNSLKTLLFISAFAPTLLSLAFIRYFSFGIDKYFYMLIFISIIGISIPITIIGLINKKSEIVSVRVKKIETNDFYLLIFLGSYLIPIILKVATVNFKITAIVIFILFIILWIISSIPTHPILYAIRYRFYKIESEEGVVYFLITKRNIRSPKSINYVKQISNSMLME